MTYASTIQSNQAKIVALAPEGKLVQKGDLLILFDAAPFEEEIRKNQALLAQAEAELLKAREDLKLQAIQNQEELLAARLRVEKSDLEMKDVQEGKGRRQGGGGGLRGRPTPSASSRRRRRRSRT